MTQIVNPKSKKKKYYKIFTKKIKIKKSEQISKLNF